MSLQSLYNKTSNQQEYIWYEGQRRPVYVDESGKKYVVVDGKPVDVSVSVWSPDLESVPQDQVDFYTKKIEESEERQEALDNSIKENNTVKKMFREQLANATTSFKKVVDEYNNLLASIGVKRESDITDSSKRVQASKLRYSVASAKDVKKALSGELYAANMTGVSLSSRYLSECLTQFDLVLDKGEWENQLTLAQNMEQNFGV